MKKSEANAKLRSLAKGLEGDWQKEGYKLSHVIEQDPHIQEAKVIRVLAHSPSGEQVADIPFSYNWESTGKLLNADNTQVHPDHRRKGIATAAYSYAEKLTGGKVNTSYDQTDDAKKFWSQPDRPFGKSEANAKLRSLIKKTINPS